MKYILIVLCMSHVGRDCFDFLSCHFLDGLEHFDGGVDTPLEFGIAKEKKNH